MFTIINETLNRTAAPHVTKVTQDETTFPVTLNLM